MAVIDFQKNNYIERFRTSIEADQILKLRLEKLAYEFPVGTNVVELLPLMKTLHSVPAHKTTVIDDVVTIGDSFPALGQAQTIRRIMELLIPWKKGPYRFLGEFIDTEWRSDHKWNRIKPHLGGVEGARIADIGASNGYFMYQLAEMNPEIVVGFEPFMKLWYHFAFLQHFSQTPNIVMEPLGIEHIDLYPKFFDTVLCLGILYHHTDPVGLLKKVYKSLKTGGNLIVECQGIPGDDSIALCPHGRYAGARSIWFLPTLSCLENWLKRSQFRNIEFIFSSKLEAEEQRTTNWAPIASLTEYLDAKDPNLTIEGYPAPWRFYVKAIR